MNGYEFLVHIATIFAWPLVFIVLILSQHKSIGEVIKRATKFRLKFWKAELLWEDKLKNLRNTVDVAEKELQLVDLRDAVKPVSKLEVLPAPDPAPVEHEEPRRSHERLDEFVGNPQDSVRPSLVVEISWRSVLDELRALLVSRGNLGQLERPSVETMLASIIGNQLLPSLIVDSISGLYGTKIQVSSVPGFEPEWDTVKEYEAQAQKIVRAIRRYA